MLLVRDDRLVQNGAAVAVVVAVAAAAAAAAADGDADDDDHLRGRIAWRGF